MNVKKIYRFGFIIEQVLGHKTHGENLQVNIPKDPEVEACWGFPAWPNGLGAKVPLYNNWTVQAGWQARKSIAAMQNPRPLHALFFHTQVTAVLAPDWLKRIPSIISLDATPLQYDSLGEFYAHRSGPTWLERYKWQLNHNALHATRHLVTWSHWARCGLIDEYGVAPEKITVIPPGVNTQEWSRPEPRLPHQEPIRILFVGGNLERKGGRLLLNAFRALRRQLAPADRAAAHTPIELHLVTRDPVPPEPGVFVHNKMQPNSEALRQLYHQSDIFCLPTYGDCLPMVLSEAAAAGLPMVSTAVAAIPEIVKDEKTGLLVPVGDDPALLATLERLVLDTNLRLQLGTEAEKLARQQFDAQKNAFHLLVLLKQIAHNPMSSTGSQAELGV